PYGKKPFVVPRALSIAEIKEVVKDYAAATKRALNAGFDGVEIHGANGYLIDQFLRDCSNLRTDAYGGTPANRVRFLGEVTEAVVKIAGANRVGVRLSPKNPSKGMKDSDPTHTFGLAAETLNAFGLAYLHVMEGLPDHPFAAKDGERITPILRHTFKGMLI